jgi:DNA repair exonuclease SbcCD nuclease subunit
MLWRLEILLVLSFFSCALEKANKKENYVENKDEITSEKFNTEPEKTGIQKILVFGDSGTGDEAQFRVADGMKQACMRDGCDFALMLGDNFYDSGVKSADDNLFVERFLNPYGPLNIIFHVVLGNHDYAVGSKDLLAKFRGYGNADAQVEYSKKSEIWSMPAKYYNFTEGKTEFFALDSTRFDQEQLKWLENKLSTSKAANKIVMAHHPIRSYGFHGDTEILVKDVLPLLCRYKVDAYVSGHDHGLQIIKEEQCPLTHIISGASAKNDGIGHHKKKAKLGHPYLKGKKSVYSHSGLGFMRLEIMPELLKIIVYGENGEELYDTELKKNNLESTEQN